MIGNLAGNWSFKEYPVREDGAKLLDESPGTGIIILLNDNGEFDVVVPLKAGTKLLKDLSPIIDEKLRPTLSQTWWDDDGACEYALRLVFDIVSSEIVIVEGPLGSTIEYWKPSNKIRIFQPSDMGTITGSKTGAAPKRE